MMCTLSVLSKGYLVKDLPKIGKVHSVFQRAVNIIFGDQLITILNRSYANFPTALRINHDAICWQNWLIPNEVVNYSENGIQTNRLVITTNQADNWHPTLFTYRINTAISKNIIGQLVQLLEQHRLSLMQHDELLQLLSIKQRWRTQLTITNDNVMLNQYVSALIGFGEGLTPDGDDFLVGYLASFLLVANNDTNHAQLLKEKQHIETLCHLIKLHLSDTNRISSHHLNLAINGHFSEPIHNLINACCDVSLLPKLKSSTDALLNYGASSGLSCLAGIIQGFNNRYS